MVKTRDELDPAEVLLDSPGHMKSGHVLVKIDFRPKDLQKRINTVTHNLISKSKFLLEVCQVALAFAIMKVKPGQTIIDLFPFRSQFAGPSCSLRYTLTKDNR